MDTSTAEGMEQGNAMDFVSDARILRTVAEGRALLDVLPKPDKPW